MSFCLSCSLEDLIEAYKRLLVSWCSGGCRDLVDQVQRDGTPRVPYPRGMVTASVGPADATEPRWERSV